MCGFLQGKDGNSLFVWLFDDKKGMQELKCLIPMYSLQSVSCRISRGFLLFTGAGTDKNGFNQIIVYQKAFLYVYLLISKVHGCFTKPTQM